ncbi:MAG: trigger factor [Oligoflexia bacterium]|nr:trigger factor [Oligoflexia bacterium]
MKSEVQKLSGLSRRLSVEVPLEVVTKAFEKQYQEVQRAASFKGFRPGKAPMSLVKAEYRSKVENDVVSQIIQDHYGKALDQHELDPVNRPEIEFQGFKEGEPLKFSATFEVRPDVVLKQYTGLDVEKEKLEIKPEVVEQIIEDIRKSKASMVPLIELRAAQLGDVAIIDFHGKLDGRDLPGGSGQEHMLELGANQFIPGFEEGVIGMTSGQNKTLNLKFPEDYHAKEIAGKNVEFLVTLKEIKKKVLPVLDEEFAKTIGHDSIAQLREEIKKDVESREEKRVKDDLKNRLLHALVEKNNFEVPKSMVAQQKAVLIDDIRNRMENQGMSAEQFNEYKEKWDADFDKSAEFVIRSSLLISTIARQENLMSSAEEYEAKLTEYTKQSGIEIEKIRAFYSKPENSSRLRFQMTEEKVMVFLTEKAKIKEVPKEKLKKIDNEQQ